MMIEKGTRVENQAIKMTAEFMCASARTAPKAKGIDNIITAIVSGKDKRRLAEEMDKIGRKTKKKSFLRDSKNIKKAPLVVLIGTRVKPIGLAVCGLCGLKNCGALEKAGGICVFNSGDLGIALGSAISVAANFHIDNRIMYTAGIAALRLKLLGKEAKIVFGIPLSVSGKSPFFDRR
jgi:uncharacterized ferredoxin-like protein